MKLHTHLYFAAMGNGDGIPSLFPPLTWLACITKRLGWFEALSIERESIQRAAGRATLASLARYEKGYSVRVLQRRAIIIHTRQRPHRTFSFLCSHNLVRNAATWVPFEET